MKLGLTFAMLAETEKMSRSSFTACSQGHFYSDRVQKSLAKALNVPAETLFPERYEEGKALRSSKKA
jgi:lambda repressor-like predicted transcriptional regulator